MILAAVAGFSVQKDKTGVNLVLLQIEVPSITIVCYFKGDGLLAAGTRCQEVPHQASLPAPPRGGQLQFGQQLILAGHCIRIKRDCDPQKETAALTVGSKRLNLECWELHKRRRCRHMLVAQGGKPVICTDE